jgi:signal transduction histidine kinase
MSRADATEERRGVVVGPFDHLAIDKRRLSLAGAYVLGYGFLDWISFVHDLHGLAITPWNPPPALTLVLLLRGGIGYWPAALTAPLVCAFLVPEPHLPPAAALAGALLSGAIYTAAAAALRRGGFDPSLPSLADLVLLFWIGSAAAAVAAFAQIGIYLAAGLITAADFGEAAFQVWLGDAIGIAAIAPLLLLCPTRPAAFRPTPLDLLEVLAQAATILTAIALIFGVVHGDEQFKYFYLLFLPLVWAAARGGIFGAAWTVAFAQVALIAGLEWHAHPIEDVRSFQALMFALAVTGTMLGCVVSERRRAEARARAHEAELAKVSRLSVAGAMASALAHELNQPLAAISAYAQGSQRLLRRPEPDREAVAEGLRQIFAQSERAGGIIHGLREFLREGIVRRSPTPVEEILRGAIALARVEAGQSGIEIVTAIAPGVPALAVDRIQIEQVVLNLVRNAVEAILEAGSPRGRVRVAAEQAVGAVAITVEDTGPGLPDPAASRLFEPFVTTKPLGMGLGLAISRSIVEAHGGQLAAAARPGGGTVFRLVLPLGEARP